MLQEVTQQLTFTMGLYEVSALCQRNERDLTFFSLLRYESQTPPSRACFTAQLSDLFAPSGTERVNGIMRSYMLRVFSVCNAGHPTEVCRAQRTTRVHSLCCSCLAGCQQRQKLHVRMYA